MNTLEGLRSITSFRSSIRSLLHREAVGARRDLVIFALDGVPYELARPFWLHARIEKMCSVFPTTSSSAWLSCLSGVEVARHGVPGVVFRLDRGVPINVFEHQGALGLPRMRNIFSDAAEIGYEPIALMGDLEQAPCAWLNVLLEHARIVKGWRFYTADPEPAHAAMAFRVHRAIAHCLDQPSSVPRLVWCFVEVDRRIHRYGYDEQVLGFLERVDALALQLAQRGAVVVAHSDHGLVRTCHSAQIARTLARLSAQFGCMMGGAGRTRWLYPGPRSADRLLASLRRELPDTVDIRSADEAFACGSLSRGRVGEIMLVARGDDFLTFDGQTFDHGSDTDAELYVPYAVWDV